MPYSTIGREYLLREGLPPDRVIKTGSPMYEVLHYYMPKIQRSEIRDQLKLKEKDYFVVSCHREENVDSDANFRGLVEVLNGLASTYDKRVIMTTHPRTRKRMEEDKIKMPALVEMHKPFGLNDYVNLQMNAKIVFSDSGTITEESSILNFPALNIRQAHERPEGMEEGSVMMVGLSWPRIKEALAVSEKQPRGNDRLLNIVEDYNVPNVSEKVVRIILSYADYVNRVVWRKD